MDKFVMPLINCPNPNLNSKGKSYSIIKTIKWNDAQSLKFAK
jgi:hypothetical protein